MTDNGQISDAPAKPEKEKKIMETRSTRKMITESDVFEAARELVAAGEQPSTLAVQNC